MINRLPTSGTMKKAVGEEPYLASMTCMLAMAVGTAPRPKPVWPTVMTAASKFLPMKRKVTKIPKMAMSTIWASRMTIIGSARSINCHSFMVIMERARNISREMLEIMASQLFVVVGNISQDRGCGHGSHGGGELDAGFLESP